MDTNQPLEATPSTPATEATPTSQATAIPTEASTTAATQPIATPALQRDGAPIYVQVPLWKNPRILIAAAAAIIVIAAGVFFSQSTKGLKGSFDQYDPATDFKINTFTVTQSVNGSLELTYNIDKKATNLFMAVTKPAADDLPENDEMIKLIALSDADLEIGGHKIVIAPDDVKTSFLTTAIYRFQIIAYNTNDEITDFKAEKHTVTVENGKVKLGDTVK